MTDTSDTLLIPARTTVPCRGSVTLERVDTLAGLLHLKNAWDRVQNASPWKHVLLDHRWVCAWWRHFGDGRQLHVLVLREDGQIVGIAPFVLSHGWEAYPARDSMAQDAEDQRYLPRVRWRRIVPIRRVGFPLSMASQNVRAHLLLTEENPELYEIVLRYWEDRSREWDLLMLEGLPADSPQPAGVEQASRHVGLRPLPHGISRSLARAELAGSMDEFLKSRTRHFRKRLKPELRAAEQAGRLDFRAYRGTEIEEGLNVVFDMERRTWKARGDPKRTVHQPLDDRSRAFFLDVGRSFASGDDAEVLVLTVDGRPVNSLFTLAREKTVLTLLTYLDDEYRGRVTSAPLFFRFFERAIERGYHHVDIHGRTVQAQKWSNGSASFRRLYLFNRRPYSRLLALAKAGAAGASRMLRILRHGSRKTSSDGQDETASCRD